MNFRSVFQNPRGFEIDFDLLPEFERGLNILAEPGFLAHVRRMADLFSQGLAALQAKHPEVLASRRKWSRLSLRRITWSRQ